jgi:uncharacterized protein
MSVVKNAPLRAVLFTVGVISLILGVVGIFLPVLPTTPFVLLSAWCFVKSSPKAHKWLYEQPYIGAALGDWERNRSISRQAKLSALITIAVSAGMMWWRVESLWLKVGVSAILATVSVWIVTRRSV